MVLKRGSVTIDDLKGMEIVGETIEMGNQRVIRGVVRNEIPFERFRDLMNKTQPFRSPTGTSRIAIEIETPTGLILPLPLSAEVGTFYFSLIEVGE